MSFSLADLTGDDAKKKIAESVKQSQQKVADMISFYEALHGTKAPDSIKDYASGDWHALLGDAAREVLEFYDTHQQAIDRKRVMRASDAVKVMEDYETELVKLVLTDPRQLFVGRKKTLALAEFGTRHFGEIAIQIWNLNYAAYDAVAKAVKFKLWDLLNPWAILKTSITVAQIMLKLLPVLLSLIVAGCAALAAGAFVEQVEKLWNKASYKANIKAMNDRRKIAESIARSKALPQRKGRVRRRKRSRR